MQAVNLSVDPGPGAIKPEMYSYEIEEIVKENLAEVGPVIGLNNHEGSLITASQSDIGTVLDVCKEKGIIFLDSRTNSESKARQAALERGMTILERDIFLDNIQEKNTKDLTHTSDFFIEENLGKKETLINFLNWVNEHYKAENVILQFSNHGGGPRSAPRYLKTKEGMVR